MHVETLVQLANDVLTACEYLVQVDGKNDTLQLMRGWSEQGCDLVKDERARLTQLTWSPERHHPQQEEDEEDIDYGNLADSEAPTPLSLAAVIAIQ